MTAIDFLVEGIRNLTGLNIANDEPIIEQAKKIERQDAENKAIHFAEWLTSKDTLTLMSLYEQFEETEYKHQSNKESL